MTLTSRKAVAVPFAQSNEYFKPKMFARVLFSGNFADAKFCRGNGEITLSFSDVDKSLSRHHIFTLQICHFS